MTDSGFHESDKDVLSRAWDTKNQANSIRADREKFDFHPNTLLEAAGKLYEPILHSRFSAAIDGIKTWLHLIPNEYTTPFTPPKKELEKIMGQAQRFIKEQGLLDKEIAIAHERAGIIQNIAKKNSGKYSQQLTAEDLAAANLVYDDIVDRALKMEEGPHAPPMEGTYKEPTYPNTTLELVSIRHLSSVVLDQLRENLPNK